MLPPELKQKIWQAIGTGIDTDGDPAGEIFEAFAALLVRENRAVRQEILRFGQVFANVANSENITDKGVVAGYVGEETCKYITSQIIKPRVYNAKKLEKPDIDRLIQDFYEQDDDL